MNQIEIAPPITTPFPGYCLNDWIGFGSGCYIFLNSEKSFPEAAFDCAERNNSFVVTILSQVELTFVKELLSEKPFASSIWIGLNKNSQGDFYKFNFDFVLEIFIQLFFT